jgi:hypothetical protein
VFSTSISQQRQQQRRRPQQQQQQLFNNPKPYGFLVCISTVNFYFK